VCQTVSVRRRLHVLLLLSSSAFSLYPGGNAYVTAFDFPPFRWPHSDFGERLHVQTLWLVIVSSLFICIEYEVYSGNPQHVCVCVLLEFSERRCKNMLTAPMQFDFNKSHPQGSEAHYS
jgi:hypothetical protein